MSQEPQPKNPARQLISVIALPVILAGLVILGISAFNILKPQKYAGEIFGKRIPQAEFDRVNTYNRLQSLVRYGKAFESIEPLLDLDTEAWDQLLLLKEARRQKIKVSDKDIIDEIAKYPFFFRNDKFDSMLYRDIIRNSLKAEPKEFEESVRQALLTQHLRDKVTETAGVTDEELLAEFQKRRDLIQVQYAVIDDKPFLEQAELSEEEIRAYFDTHADEFAMDESVRIEYVWLAFPPDGGIQKQVETKFKGRAVIDRHVKNGMSLADAAKSMGYELKETGFFTRDDAPPDIGIDWNFDRINSTFRMKKDELSAPVEQKTGYAIIRMMDKQPPHTPTFEEVRDKVAAKVKALKASDMAVQKAESYIPQINALIKLGGTFQSAATELGLTVKDNALTQRESVVNTLGIKEDSVEALAQTAVDTIAPVLHSSNGAMIVFLNKSVPISEKAFQKSGASFRKIILNEKKDKIFESFLKDLRKKAELKKY